MRLIGSKGAASILIKRLLQLQMHLKRVRFDTSYTRVYIARIATSRNQV